MKIILQHYTLILLQFKTCYYAGETLCITYRKKKKNDTVFIFVHISLTLKHLSDCCVKYSNRVIDFLTCLVPFFIETQ